MDRMYVFDLVNRDIKEVAAINYVEQWVLLWTNTSGVRATTERFFHQINTLDNSSDCNQLKAEKESLMMAHDHLHQENRELKNRVRKLEEKCNVDDVLPKRPEISI